jgi:hypothetical protein
VVAKDALLPAIDHIRSSCSSRRGSSLKLNHCDIPNCKPGKSANATEAYINLYVVSTSNDRIQFRK